ncbi:hypothetical protein N431DRAFT_366681, partial [Stipitochalara longipes BDJ]
MIRILKKTFLYNFPDEILLKICFHLTSDELYQLSLSCQALSRIGCEILSRALRLDYAYHDDRKLSQVNEIVNKLKRRSGGFLSDITIAYLTWPVSSQLCRRMHHILSLLPNIKTLHLKEQFDSLRGYFVQTEMLEGMDANLFDVLLHSPSASTIRSLTISDTRISSHDILKLFAMKQLEYLSIDGFNYPMGIEPGEDVPHSQLESLSISTTAKPTGRHIDILLARIPKLKIFSWKFDFSSVSTQEQFKQVCSPAAISTALNPLSSTLEELQISMAPTKFRNDGTGLCLSSFNKLRRLEVHEEVFFPSCNELSYLAFCHGLGAQLWDRLPRNLETLEIISDNHKISQTECSATENHTLILDLATSKKMHIRSLSHISITQRGFTTSKE